MIKLNSIIINDNKETLTLLEKFVEENSMIMNIVGSTASIKEAITLIKKNRPEVVFIDITFKDDAFFDMLAQIEFNTPKLVFISEHHNIAVKAFKNNAIDFILKPIEFNNVILALYKVIEAIKMERIYQDNKISNINILNAQNQGGKYVAVASIDKVEIIHMTNIMYCAAEGKYTYFHLLNGKKIMSSKNLGEYSTILSNSCFFRIHHSYIINVHHISIISKKNGYYCEFPNGIALPIAKRRQEDFNKFIKLRD